MHRPLLLRGARQLLTLRGADGPRRGAACLDLGLINDGSVLIRDGRIISVGHSRRIDNLAEARNAIVYEAHGCVIMPGMIDCSFPIPANAALARRALRLAFIHGSLTVGVIGPYFPLRALGTGETVSPSLVPSLDIDCLPDEGQLQRAVRRDLATFLRLDLLAHSRENLRLFSTLGPALRLHCDSPDYHDWIGLALAYGASVVDVDHPLNRSQIALLSDSSVASILKPASASMARVTIDGGAIAALGSGFSASGPGTCSMQTAVLLASRHGGLDIAESITLSTINAAYALGIGSTCGSIESGKQANLLVLQLSDYRDFHSFTGVNVVSKIIQAGTLVS